MGLGANGWPNCTLGQWGEEWDHGGSQQEVGDRRALSHTFFTTNSRALREDPVFFSPSGTWIMDGAPLAGNRRLEGNRRQLEGKREHCQCAGGTPPFFPLRTALAFVGSKWTSTTCDGSPRRARRGGGGSAVGWGGRSGVPQHFCLKMIATTR